MKKNHRNVCRILITAFLFLILMVIVKIRGEEGINQTIQLLLYLLIYFLIGYDIIIKSIRNIFRGQLFDENFLMTIASLSAFFVSEYSEAILVMLLYQIGEAFQKHAVDNSRKSIAELMDICEERANVERNGQIIQVDSEDVKIGEIIIIKPGEKVPLDSIVIKGNSMLDTSALTGESVPINVTKGMEILSGSINKDSIIKAKVIREYENSTATKIIELVENATDKKSRSENFISRFAKYYTPIVVIAAAILAIIPPLLFRLEWGDWINRACIFLITSCPCALVISIPLSFFGSVGRASKKGILVKGSNYLEELSKIDTFVFDKTGTLTKGNFRVNKIIPNEVTNDELMDCLAMVEKNSNHPIAKAIMDNYSKKEVEYEYDCYREISGKGIDAVVDGKHILAGNYKLMQDNNVCNLNESEEIGTIVYVAYDNNYIGCVVISDEIKDESITLIKELERLGIKKTIMLTGDKKLIADEIANKIGLSEVYSELFPKDKVDMLEELLNKNLKVAYIGDGINDAPVLARADVGISMGKISSDAAIEASDIVLVDNNLLKVIDAIKISRKTVSRVKQNIIFSLGVKAIVLVLGALGLANMWFAIFADVGVLILAVLNAMRKY